MVRTAKLTGLIFAVSVLLYGQASPISLPSFGGGGGGGSSLSKTIELSASDTLGNNGVWMTNGSSACGNMNVFIGTSLTATLSSAIPSSPCPLVIMSTDPSGLSVGRNGLLFNGGTSNVTLQQYQAVTFFPDSTTGWKFQPPYTAGSNITLTPSSTGLQLSAAAGSYSTFQGVTANIPMTGSNVALYTVSNVPALAAGKCYSVHVTTGPEDSVSYNAYLYVDTTQVSQVAHIGGANFYGASDLSMCNNAGVQNAQTIYAIQAGYFNGAAGSQALTPDWSMVGSTVINTSAIDWSTTHTITIYGSAASGNLKGQALHIWQN